MPIQSRSLWLACFQVPDPRAPEYEPALTRHEAWWDTIISTQAAKGVDLITVEPEHGTGTIPACVQCLGLQRVCVLGDCVCAG